MLHLNSQVVFYKYTIVCFYNLLIKKARFLPRRVVYFFFEEPALPELPGGAGFPTLPALPVFPVLPVLPVSSELPELFVFSLFISVCTY